MPLCCSKSYSKSYYKSFTLEIHPNQEMRNQCLKQFVGNKTNFPKKEHFLPHDTHTYLYAYAYAHVMFVFWKILRALFFWNARFEISLFAVIPTNWDTRFKENKCCWSVFIGNFWTLLVFNVGLYPSEQIPVQSPVSLFLIKYFIH